MRRYALLLPLLAIGAAARAPFRLENLLPETTLLFAETPSASDFRAAFKKTPLHALFQEEEVRQFADSAITGFLKETADFRREFEKALGIPWDSAWELPTGQIAFAASTILQEKDSQPDLVLTLDCAGRRATLQKALAFVRERHDARAAEKAKVWKTGDVEVLSGALNRDLPWHAAVLDDALVVTTWKGRMEQIVGALRQPPAKPLSRSTTFTKAREKSGGKELFLYADLAGFVRGVEERLGDDAKKVVRALGLQGFTTAAGGLSFGPRFVKERFFLGTAGERKGLAKLLSLKGAAHGFEAAPEGSLQYLSFSIDAGELYDTVLEILKGSNEIDYQQALDRIDRFEKESGISLRNDLFPAFGPRITSYSALPREGFLPDSVTCFEIKDAARFDKCLKAALRNLGAELGPIDFRGKRIECLKFTAPAEFDPLRMILSSLYILRDGEKLYVTGIASVAFGYGAANALKREILRRERPRLSASAPVREWLGGKTDGASLVLYWDLERTFTHAYNTSAPLVVMFQGLLRTLGLRADLMRLPLGETIGRHLGASVHLVHAEPDGLRVDGFSASGMSITTLAFAGAAAVVAYPAVARSLEEGKTASCLSTCYSVYFAAVNHQQQKQKFPAKTGADFVKELRDLGFLREDPVCAHAGKSAFRGPAKDVNQMADTDVIFCDEPGSHPDGSINVVRKNGQIETLKAGHPDIKKALETTKGD